MTGLKRVIIAGGGTGGHIYPGLAVAETLKKKHPEIEVLFVGTAEGLESKVVPSKGLKLLTIPVLGLNRVGIFRTIKSLTLLPFSFLKSLYFLLKFRPKYVLGMGGYASGPFVLVASLLGFKTAIWEINAKPGVTNRILSKFVSESWVVFDEAKPNLKTKVIKKVGMPVRASILASGQKGESKGNKKVLIFGGSQGARGINLCASVLLQNPPSWLAQSEVRFQTGELDFPLVKERLKDKANVTVLSYLTDIEKDYEWADVVICRAGASTLAELAASGKASILIPFPFAADDHQKLNAQSVAKKGACRVILQKDLTPESLSNQLHTLLFNDQERKSLEENIHKLHSPGAADLMSDQIWENLL